MCISMIHGKLTSATDVHPALYPLQYYHLLSIGSDLSTVAAVVPPLLPGERLVAGGAVEAVSIGYPAGRRRVR